MTARRRPSPPVLVDEDGDVIGPDGYTDANRPDEDSPDLSTPSWVERFSKVPVRVGPPTPPVEVLLQLDPEVVAAFQAAGPGWRARMADALRAVMPPQPADPS